MKEFAIKEWKKALKALDSARKIVESDPDSAASRAYYAAFHAVTAVFALRGQSFSKHSAIRSAVHRELVKPGQWNTELGKDFDFLMEVRETGDYGGIVEVSHKDALMSLKKAANIIKAAEQIYPKLFN